MRRRFDEPGPTLAELGETTLLQRLAGQAAAVGPGAAAANPGGRQRTPPHVVVGSGDDAAVLAVPAGAWVVTTQDALVEDVDFRRSWSTPAAVGAKAVALSLSDLAAMGARPLGCTATVCAPVTTRVDDLLAIQAGLLLRGSRSGCPLVGGDLSATTGPLVIDVCALGAVFPDRVLRRDAGRSGDTLVVTGRLGRAAAGLALLEGRLPSGEVPDGGAGAGQGLWQSRARALQTHGLARLDEGRALAAAGIRCGGDLSDGLLVDAQRTAAASHCGVELWCDHLPVDPELRALAGDGWLDLAIAGGEDFELLASVDPGRLDTLLAGWDRPLAALHVVGRLTDGAGLRLLDGRGGRVVPPPRVRSRHFLAP